MKTVTKVFPCLNLLGVKGRKSLTLCPMQDIIFFPPFFIQADFSVVNSTLFHAHPACPPCPPLLHLPFSFSVPHFSLYAVFPLISSLPVLGVEGPGGLETESTPCLHPARLLAGFSSRIEPDLP